GIRTPDLCLRRATLYPAELRAQVQHQPQIPSPLTRQRERTRGIVRIPGTMVGATGFEPATSCSRSRRATGLRYAPPTKNLLVNEPSDAPGESRTPNLLIRSQMLYPIELRAPNDRIT